MTPAHRLVATQGLVLLLIAGCGGGGGGGSPTPPPPATYTASGGVAQKGPLILGSTVTAQELSATLAPTGKQYSYQINSDLGTFDPSSTFTSQYVGTSATGYYFDEITNAVSTGTITLNGYTDLSSGSALNVNLLTTLAYQRIQTLIKSGRSFSAAQTQAENEVLAAFNIPNGASYGAFGSFDLSKAGDGNHILAALSSLFVFHNTSGELASLMANVQSDIGANGTITSADTKTALAAAAKAIDTDAIAANLTAKYASAAVTFKATDIGDWLDRDGDGIVGKFKYRLAQATPSSTFTFPVSTTDPFAGTQLSLSTGVFYVNGSAVTGSVTTKTGDILSASPLASFSKGALVSYLMSGTTKIARVSFYGHDSWSPLAPMATERRMHTASAIAGGKVLVAGGLTSYAKTLTSAEIYDPNTNTWIAAASMSNPRYGHAATVLNDGTVLVVGGEDDTGNNPAIAERYDPLSNTWSSAGSMSIGRPFPTISLLTDGRVLVACGLTGYPNTAEIYDPATNSWSPTPPPQDRVSCTTTVLPGGKVLLAGGTTDAQLYDPAINVWLPAGNSSVPRDGYTATLLPNGKVLVAGGYTNPSSGSPSSAAADIYDPVANTWSPTGALMSARQSHTATLLSDGKVLVAGGRGLTSLLASSELYDPGTGTWTTTSGDLDLPIMDYTATPLADGRVLVVGGQTATGTVAAPEAYWP